MNVPKQARLQEFYKRLHLAAPAGTREEAFQLYCRIMNAVEDELTGVPFDPPSWATDGRMYPPQYDRIVPSPAPGITGYRSRKHITYMGENGSIEVTRLDGTVEFRKAGTDGLHVREQSDLRS